MVSLRKFTGAFVGLLSRCLYFRSDRATLNTIFRLQGFAWSYDDIFCVVHRGPGCHNGVEDVHASFLNVMLMLRILFHRKLTFFIKTVDDLSKEHYELHMYGLTYSDTLSRFLCECFLCEEYVNIHFTKVIYRPCRIPDDWMTCMVNMVALWCTKHSAKCVLNSNNSKTVCW